MSLRGTIVKSKSLSDLQVSDTVDGDSINNGSNGTETDTEALLSNTSHDGHDHHNLRSRSPKAQWKVKLIDLIDTIEDSICKKSPTTNEVKRKLMTIFFRKNTPQSIFYIVSLIFVLLCIFIFTHKHYHHKYQYSKANDQSYGLFQHINNRHWKTLKEYYHSSTPHKFGTVDTFIDEPNVWYQYNWNKNFVCPQEERIGVGLSNGRGELGDGPKWVCNSRDIVRVVNERMASKSLDWAKSKLGNSKSKEKQMNKKCLIYSIGVNAHHLGFEMGIQKILTQEAGAIIDGYKAGTPFCDIHVFDPDGYHEKLVIEDGIYYHNWGIRSSIDDKSNEEEHTEGDVQFKTFQETVKELNHEGRVLDIMKVDCKMCEWSIYQDWFDQGGKGDDGDDNSSSSSDDGESEYTGLAMIQQLLVEVHGTPAQTVNAFFERLKDEKYVIFHKDANTEQFAGTSQDYAFLKLTPEFFDE